MPKHAWTFRLAMLVSVIGSLIVLLTWPIALLTYISPYYFNAFERYNVYPSFSTSYSREKVNQEFTDILRFIQPISSSTLDASYFSYEDVIHMQDVQHLFQAVYVVSLISFTITWLIYLVMYRFDLGFLTALSKADKYFQGSILIVVIVISVFLAFWQYTFVGVHPILFPNNSYWQLNPQTSNLIKYLPSQIFEELLVIYIGVVMIEFLLIRYIIKRQVLNNKAKLA